MHVPWNRLGADGAAQPGGGEWNRVLVYGLGLSGRAAAEWLRHQQVEVVGIDQRPAQEMSLGSLSQDPGTVLWLGDEPDQLPDDLSWNAIDGVVVSPGVPADRPLLRSARAAGVPIIAEVELAFPWLNGPVLAITGSNGKSTTTAIAGAMLRAAGFDAQVCGNIGEPLTSKLQANGADHDSQDPKRVFVVELSSFQLETVDRFHPQAAALLNLTPDHLDRHPSYEHYRDAKLAIFRRQTADDIAVLNADDPDVVGSTANLKSRRRFFSLQTPVADGCYLDGHRVVEVDPMGSTTGSADSMGSTSEGPTELFEAADVPLPGPHNLENAMAAALLVRSQGVSPAAMIAGLRSFQGLPHRLQKVRELHGTLWYDDSKGTNLAATLKSLAGFPDGKVLLILGGIFKGGDLEPLCRLVGQKARIVFLIGQAAQVFETALSQADPATEIRPVEVLERAVREAHQSARPGESVVLSPACSSFDQFLNFAERGRTFQRLVHDLPDRDLQGPRPQSQKPQSQGVRHGS